MAMLIGTRRWSAVKAKHEMPAWLSTRMVSCPANWPCNIKSTMATSGWFSRHHAWNSSGQVLVYTTASSG